MAEVEAKLLGRSTNLPTALPFRNFVAQARLGVTSEEHEAFFTSMLGDVEEPTAPFGLIDVQGDGSRIVEAEQHLGGTLNGRLRAAARSTGVSAASFCHLAWAMVLARLAGRDDVVFGTLMLGRMQGAEGTDRALGMFINLLPIRIQVAQESVRASLRKTHRLLSQMLRHEHAPLLLAQRCSQVRPPAPLFNSMLNYRHSGAGMQRAEAVEGSGEAWMGIKTLDSQERTNFPLYMFIDDLVDDLTLVAQADASIDPERICRLMRTALESLADALERAPETPLCRLEVLPADERQKLLVEFNDSAVEYPREICLHTLFEEQAERTPDAIAVVFEEQALTYRELNGKANQLAHYLIDLGVKPDDRVAICVERSPEMIIGMLATLKAGGGYVPLDPTYPAERLAYMLQDSAPAVVLAQATGATLETGATPSLDLQADGALWAGEAETNPRADGLTSRHLAYVIYTSGSTGKPKGVMVEHANVVNLIHAQIGLFSLTGSDRVLQFSSYSFDTSVEEIFPALSVGAAVILRPADLVAPDTSFVNFMEKHQITVTDLPTAFWHEWTQEVRAGRSKPNTALRVVIVGGEKAELRHLADWFEGCGDHHHCWINTYGPTEATVTTTVLPVDRAIPADLANIPIGRPVPNASIHVLDARGRLAPIGMPGEIHIGGAGVARGYLNQPELTAERFIADPFTTKTGARLYKTGDLGRWLPDGNLEYLGRNDFQVKIRGFRIELGEVEATLAACTGVRQAVVIVREDYPGDKQLVAYVLPEAGLDLSAALLRRQIADSLPAYMMPRAFVQLKALPLTPNGKLDRKALPAPEGDSYASRTYEAPAGEVESTLARIWSEVLKIEQVGRNDNFFELGGHSLLAVTVIERMRRAALDVDVRALFATPTLAALASSTRQMQEVLL
jgi:amino acid adenylation domain-containing protein